MSRELGLRADGKLFGDSFIVEIRKHVASYTSLNKVETSLKEIFHPSGVSHRAGWQRGWPTSRGSYGSKNFSGYRSLVTTPLTTPPTREPSSRLSMVPIGKETTPPEDAVEIHPGEFSSHLLFQLSSPSGQNRTFFPQLTPSHQ